MKIRPIVPVAIAVLLFFLCVQVNLTHAPLSRQFSRTDDFSGRVGTSQESPFRLFRGALHMHTLYSDGNDTVAGRVANAKQVGLDFIVITDHSWNEKCREECRQFTVDGQFLCVMGWECSTKTAHVPSGFVYSKPPSPRGDWSNYFNAVRTEGGFVWVAHPQWQKDTYGEYPFDNWSTTSYNISMVSGVEAWNEACRQCRPDPTVYAAGTVWDSLLSKGYRIWSISAEDRHAKGGLGHAVVTVYAYDLTLSSIAQSLREGRFNSIRTPYAGYYQNFRFNVKASELGFPGSTITVLKGQDVTIRVEYEITWLTQAPAGRVDKVQIIRDGQILYDDGPLKPFVNLTIIDRPQKLSRYRIWVKDTTGGWAFSNPIFVNPVPSSYYEAKELILQAEETTRRAEQQGRTQGLEMAREKLKAAQSAFNSGKYDVALSLAKEALELAEKATGLTATIPPAMYRPQSWPETIWPCLAVAVVAVTIAITIATRRYPRRGE